MAIELITGTPGSGKTTFCVAVRLVAESKRMVPIEDDDCDKLGLDRGTAVQRRLVVSGIRGLVMDHERLPHVLTRDAPQPSEVQKFNAMQTERSENGKVEESETPVFQRLPGEPARTDVPALVQNWWLWCKPGDLIVVDEAQFVAPRGTLGRKPPYWVQALEIHRHYGVDFIFITQHPGLIDTTIRALVGLHRHVRSVMGSPMCMVYVWDHASNPERFSLATKATFLRRPAHYRLFHSSVAHIKPPTSGRSIVVVVPLLLLVVGIGVARMRGRFSPPAAVPVADSASSPGALGKPGSSPSRVLAVAGYVDVPKLSGCMAYASTCQCWDMDGQPVGVDAAMCERSSRGAGLVRWERSTAVRYVDHSTPAAESASAPGQRQTGPMGLPLPGGA